MPFRFTIYWADPGRTPATISAEGWTEEGGEYVFDCSLTPGMPDRFAYPSALVRAIVPNAPNVP
ncbi:MAG: hypothetical protein ACLQVK_02380 [Acidimicrobiales bacterium]